MLLIDNLEAEWKEHISKSMFSCVIFYEFTSVHKGKALNNGKLNQFKQTESILTNGGLIIFYKHKYIKKTIYLTGFIMEWGVVDGPTHTDSDKSWIQAIHNN